MAMNVEAEIRDLKRRVSEIEGSFGFLTEQVKTVHKDLLAFQEQTEQRFDKVDGRLDRLESKIDSVDRKIDTKIDGLAKSYEYVIIDTPPTLGLITVNALVASDYLIVPIQPSYFALEGTDDLLDTVEKVRARPNPNLKVLGVLITLLDKRTTLAKDIHEQIRQVFGEKVFDTVISKSVRLEESPAFKESIFTFAPNSSGAVEYARLCEEVMRRV